jgi:uncharacterized protein
MLLLSPIPTRAAEPTQISVTGVGTVTLPPDKATVDATVVTNNPTSSGIAMSQNEATYERIVSALVALGIARSDIALSFYNVNYIAPPVDQRATYTYGFTVRRSFAVTVRTIGLAGKVVDAATAAGATNVEGVSFGLQDTTTAAGEAMERAVADATAKATALARDVHLHIAGIASITLDNAYTPFVQRLSLVHMAQASPPVPTNFDSGNASVVVTVNVVFLAKP